MAYWAATAKRLLVRQVSLMALRFNNPAAVVLGCTEIPLGIAAGPALPFPVVDTIEGLARAAIAWARPAG